MVAKQSSLTVSYFGTHRALDRWMLINKTGRAFLLMLCYNDRRLSVVTEWQRMDEN